MTATYRCCCGEPTDCCKLWCTCSDTITISLCKRSKTTEVYACESGLDCHPAAGTLVGSNYEAVEVSNLKLQRVTTTLDECPGCCVYDVVTGSGQTGTIKAWRDGYLLWCSERDGDQCVTGNLECLGSINAPLSGSAGNWSLNTFTGRLKVECCDSSSCNGQSYKASLNLHIQGGNTIALATTDCCTQTTTQSTLAVELIYGYDWDCRHQSRWEGTCPCDLMDEPGTENVAFTVTGCFDIQTPTCPSCGDYANPTCLVDPPVIEYCVTQSTSVTCTNSNNNGSIEDITGCV